MLSQEGTTGLTVDEKEWIVAGMAWVGLRRWMCGAAEAETARVWFEAQMDQRFAARGALRHITDDMARLEAQYGRLAHMAANGLVPAP